MSRNFQLQLMRKTLGELGYTDVADFLAQRLAAESSDSFHPSITSDPVLELLQAGDYPAICAILHDDYDTNGGGGSENGVNTLNSKKNDMFASLSGNARCLALYLVLRTAFLEQVLKEVLTTEPSDAEHSAFDFLQAHVSPAFDAIDKNDLTIPFVSALCKEKESAALLPLALSRPSRTELESVIFTPRILLTNVNPSAGSGSGPSQDNYTYVSRLRNSLVAVLRNAVGVPKSGATSASSVDCIDIPDNCLTDIIGKAQKYNESKSLYHLSPRSKASSSSVGSVAEYVARQNASREDLPIHVLHTLSHHTDEVWYTRFSPSGRFLATGSLDGTCLIYDVTDNFRLVAELDPNTVNEPAVFAPDSFVPSLDKKKGVIYFSWEPHERYIVTCCLDTVIRVWNVENISHKRRVTRSMISECTLVSCFTLGERMRTWPCEFLKYDKNATPHFIVGSPDKVLKVYSIDGKEVLDFYSDADEWSSILGEDSSQPSVDSSDASGGGSGLRRASNHSHSSSEDMANIHGHNAAQFNRINDFAVTPNGKVLITANNDKQVFFYKIPNLFDPSTTTSRIASLALNGRLTSCNISADGKYMLLSIAPEELQLWDISPLDTFEKPFLKQKFFGQSQAVYMVRSCFGYLTHPDKKEELVLSGSDDGHIYIWKLETGQLVTRVKGHEGLCNSVDWNRFYFSKTGPDYGKYWCSVGDDHLVKIWGPNTT